MATVAAATCSDPDKNSGQHRRQQNTRRRLARLPCHTLPPAPYPIFRDAIVTVGVTKVDRIDPKSIHGQKPRGRGVDDRATSKHSKPAAHHPWWQKNSATHLHNAMPTRTIRQCAMFLKMMSVPVDCGGFHRRESGARSHR